MRKSANSIEVGGAVYTIKSKARLKAELRALEKIVYDYMPSAAWNSFREAASGQIAVLKALSDVSPAQYRHMVFSAFTYADIRAEWLSELCGGKDYRIDGAVACLEWILGMPTETETAD